MSFVHRRPSMCLIRIDGGVRLSSLPHGLIINGLNPNRGLLTPPWLNIEKVNFELLNNVHRSSRFLRSSLLLPGIKFLSSVSTSFLGPSLLAASSGVSP